MRRFTWEPADYYDAYQAAREEAELALEHWRAVPGRDVFACYRAASDREDAAAFAWLAACAAYDTACRQLAAARPRAPPRPALAGRDGARRSQPPAARSAGPTDRRRRAMIP